MSDSQPMLDTRQPREDREPACRRRTKNILIVDDSENVRATARLAIESCTDFRVCGEAARGVEAINKTQSLNPDAVIMNLAMPEMNGVETAKLLKEKMPEVHGL
jgi:DNA-binding NarL/FixJ family response regulator